RGPHPGAGSMTLDEMLEPLVAATPRLETLLDQPCIQRALLALGVGHRLPRSVATTPGCDGRRAAVHRRHAPRPVAGQRAVSQATVRVRDAVCAVLAHPPEAVATRR